MYRLILLLLSFCILSCVEHTKNTNELTSYNGFPDSATNLFFVNSEYDDYNSAQKGDGDRGTFVFSSNRNSKGKDYDIVQYNALSFWLNFSDELTTIGTDTEICHEAPKVKGMLKTINTQKNEFAPYIYEVDLMEFLLFYAQEDSNKLNLKFMVNKVDSIINNNHYIGDHGPYNVDLINNLNCNQAYITIDNHTIYYCSDKTGNFDLYQYPIDTSVHTASQYIDFLTTAATQKPVAIADLNSKFDDKCPYVVNNFMVFTSNRKGGYGGYDLWYSQLIDNKWTEPKNFGPNINSPYDEYRPIIKACGDFGIPNDLMIFSSNRPGGKGGFDLYYVGINR